MALKGKLETVLELKSSPEKFLNLWKKQAHQVPNHSPINIQGVHLHEGDWNTHGCIKIWKYNIEGKPEVIKEKTEVDEEKKVVTITGLEGDVFKLYKVYTGIWEFTSNGQGSLTKLTLEYEKLNEDVPVPNNYLNFIISMTKDIDEGISKIMLN